MPTRKKSGSQQNIQKPKAWIITVDMGYGHQRTAYPLRYLAPDQKVINANSYFGIPKKDRDLWESSRKVYEFISRFKRVPLIGELIFYIFDKFQSIWAFYPKRDLSRPTYSLKENYSLIKKGWGCSLIHDLRGKGLPMVSTFFTPAFMAEECQYGNEIFCVVCDTDIARTWAPLTPQKSSIKYFTPNQRTTERLILYGVPRKNIFQTGYPLPRENIGREMEVAKQDLKYRLINLDPQGKYRQQYSPLVKKYLGSLPSLPSHPLTITFAIGGAGAQFGIALNLIESFKNELERESIRFILSIGVKEQVKEKIIKKITNAGLTEHLNRNIWLLFSQDINDYFYQFNEALRTTDILWTKPSELSFYTALGIPIIMAPTIGAQEEANKKWLSKIGSGIPQSNPRYAHQWLFDLLNDGWFAEAAMQGFIEVEKMGTYNIEKIISELKT